MLLTSKLSEQRESHSDGPDLSWEDFRNIEIHGRVAAGLRNAENEMAEQIRVIKRRGRVVIKNRHVADRAFADRTDELHQRARAVAAARIDGASELGIYWRIALPLMKPALGTLGLITFISSWNNFMNPLIVMRTADNYTLPLALRSLFSTTSTEWGALMAGALFGSLPVAVIYSFFVEYYVSGMTGSVKE